ncbi:MAG: cobalamin-dependent protein [Chitinispirillaceae bacterium]|nr:cobalamin-dependent protein [Chitinispirillaceae bacterium]
MKIRCIYPRFRKFLEGHTVLDGLLKRYLVGNYTMPPSLAIPIIAALTPSDIEIVLTDDNIGQPIDYNESVNLVAISCFTPQAQRAYEIADQYRLRGTKVILGGIHPTALPQEAKQHADAVCVGEVEPVWDAILKDLRAAKLQPLYQAETGTYPLAEFPIPKREIFPQDVYEWNAHLVLTTRGCPVMCIGCPIPGKEGTNVRLRPVDHIIDDIVQMPYKQFYFADDTVMLPGKKYTKFLLKIMERTASLDVSIFLASTMMMTDDPAFYRQLKKGGVSSMYTIFGFDPVTIELFSRNCSRERWRKCIDLVRMNEDVGIHFFGSFGIGFDYQDRTTVDEILRFCAESRIDLAEFYIPTPFPGTPFGKQAEAQGRILHRNYHLWNHGNIVFKPRNFTEEELLEDFYRLWRGFYRDKNPGTTLRTFDIALNKAHPQPVRQETWENNLMQSSSGRV